MKCTVRSSDPSTSQAAADRIRKAAPAVEQTIADLLAEHPEGLTIQQISDLSGIGLVTVSPRIAPMRRRGQVHSIGKRKNPSGSMALVWALAPEQATAAPAPASAPAPAPCPPLTPFPTTEAEWDAARRAYLDACADLLTVITQLKRKRSIKG